MARAYSSAGAITATNFPCRRRATISSTNTRPVQIKLYPVLASHFSNSRRISRRKNYLRPKILKTLAKPLPLTPLPETIPTEVTLPLVPIPLQPQNDTVFLSSNEIPNEPSNFEEFRVSETVLGEKRGILGKFSAKSVLKICCCLVGIYLFQAIITVWVFGDSDSDKEERFNSSDGKGNVFIKGSQVLTWFNANEVEEQISEIRAMARKVREKERMEREEGSSEETEIEKEIGERLVRLEKKLNSKRENLLPDSFVNNLGLLNSQEEDNDQGNSEDGVQLNDDEKALMFRKKFRFRSPSMNSRSNPKGFSGSRNKRILSNVNGSDSNGELRENDSYCRKKDIMMGLNSSLINGIDKLEKEKECMEDDLGSGTIPKISEGRSSSEVVETSKSRDIEKLRSSAKGKRRTTSKLDGPSSSSVNGSGHPLKKPLVNKVSEDQSAAQGDIWWLNLPYVLVILMQRSSELEGQGVFTLRILSQPHNCVDSYTVAFEDRGDANNFCCLLELHFEGLGDFSADIVPLSVKELYDGVKSGSKKAIVVKKGQLKLYAGQPLAEVETALFSLLEQDQGIS